jgi:hypothetical protein
MKSMRQIIDGDERLRRMMDAPPRGPAWWDFMPPSHEHMSPQSPPIFENGERLDDPEPLPESPPRDWRSVPLPLRMARLPRDYRGYPIFYSVQPDPAPKNGARVDFRVLNHHHHVRCATERRCAICNGRLGSELHFLGGPMCVQNRIFGDGPMHRECCDYARLVCPYLSIQSKDYRETGVNYQASGYEGGETIDDPNAILVKPQRLVEYVCREYHIKPVGNGKWLYLVPPGGIAIWYTTRGGYIARTRPTEFGQ